MRARNILALGAAIGLAALVSGCKNHIEQPCNCNSQITPERVVIQDGALENDDSRLNFIGDIKQFSGFEYPNNMGEMVRVEFLNICSEKPIITRVCVGLSLWEFYQEDPVNLSPQYCVQHFQNNDNPRMQIYRAAEEQMYKLKSFFPFKEICERLNE